jgi:glycerol kinase
MVSAGTILVVDVGTSSVRSSIVTADSAVTCVHQVPVLPSSPNPGEVEIDAIAIKQAVLSTARAALAEGGPVSGVGIANQRASTVVWDAVTSEPVGPGLGWQDLRTVIDCLLLQAEGLRLAPNLSATKLKWLLDAHDPDRHRAEHLRFGTVDTWVAWVLSNGDLHVTDATNAGVTGLVDDAVTAWDERTLGILGVPMAMMPRIVDSSGAIGPLAALDGAPILCGIAGDQQASLIGQGCTSPGLAKITFGTGGMLDVVTGTTPPSAAVRGEHGTFPIVASRRGGTTTWGFEAIMLSAGACVEWLRSDLGLLAEPADSEALAASCTTTDGVTFVPALLGLGTPDWDFGARGLLLGITRGTGRPEIVRAVLEGIAQRGLDLVEAAEGDAGLSLASLRVDGGMTANDLFLSMLADALGRPVEVSPVAEATTLGAAYLAGMAQGLWRDETEVAAAFAPRAVIEPSGDEATRASARARFLEAKSRSERTLPDLSGVEF